MSLKRQTAVALECPLIDGNGCKYLSGETGKKAFFYFRSRNNSSSYYLVTLKGNYIRAWHLQYVLNGEPINVFLNCVIPALGGTVNKPTLEKKLLCKHPIKDWEGFLKDFKTKSEDLTWYED